MRTLIRKVIADIDARAREIILVVHWMGGIHAELRLPRRRRGQRNSTSKEIVEAARGTRADLRRRSDRGLLDRNDLRTGNGNRWTRER